VLEPGRRIEGTARARHRGLREGFSTRAIDDLVEALGMDSWISKSKVSWIYTKLDEQVAAFWARRLDRLCVACARTCSIGDPRVVMGVGSCLCSQA
jgi:putative transposase